MPVLNNDEQVDAELDQQADSHLCEQTFRIGDVGVHFALMRKK
jgi:hypothetical protein